MVVGDAHVFPGMFTGFLSPVKFLFNDTYYFSRMLQHRSETKIHQTGSLLQPGIKLTTTRSPLVGHQGFGI